ncbi:MAG TPA: single-stranded DNA-binding protein [bacterium]|nr:single-stranded DNA-binding protein [bacterium]HPV65798.1 single-stranded DNA-binding protein [bacterium]
MYSLNKVMLIGNLTRDPEIRNTNSGQTVTSFSIATNLNWTDQSGQQQSKAEFHNVIAWRKLGEICGQYLSKGTKVYIEGRLQTRDWAAQDGSKRKTTEVVAENMIILSPKSGGQGPMSAGGNDDIIIPESEEEDEIKIEDIPF